MIKNRMILILIALLFSTAAFSTTTDDVNQPKLLRDGFFLSGVDGTLTRQADSERWLFELDSAVSDGRDTINAGDKLEVLPSAALEKLTADVNQHFNKSYRLWGTITKYDKKNFIFPVYFLPLSNAKPAETKAEQANNSKQQVRPSINEPNDELKIPQRILDKLKSRPIIRTEQLKKGMELKEDSILADRTGFIVKQDDGQYVFTLDAFGRNIEQISFPLLPCQILELALQEQSKELENIRFRAAGILTQYKGKNYFLLERAVRVYSYGNFTN